MTNLPFGGLLFSIAISVALIPVWVIARAIYNHFFPPKSDDPSDYISGDTESHYWPPVYPRDHPLYRDPDDDDLSDKEFGESSK